MMSMPPAMKRKFSLHLYRKTLTNVPIFRDLSAQVVQALGDIVRPMIAVRQQVIMSEGSIGSEMYMIISGELEIT